MFQVFRITLSLLLLLGALAWLVTVGWAKRESWLTHAEYGGSSWLRWMDGEQRTGIHTDQATLDGRICFLLAHMQGQVDRPLHVLWLRRIDFPTVPVPNEQFEWGKMAAAVHPGRILVGDPAGHLQQADVVFTPLWLWQDWTQQPGMEGLEQRFPHMVDLWNLRRFAVTEELAWLLDGLDDNRFRATVEPGLTAKDPASISERKRARASALAWAGLFGFVLVLQGWLLLRWLGIAGRGGPFSTSPWLLLPMALALGTLAELVVLWLLGFLGLGVSVWGWRMAHLLPLTVAGWLVWRRYRRDQTMADGDQAGEVGRGRWPWSMTGVLATVTGVMMLLLVSGPGPLHDAPGLVRDGYKTQRFFEHGGIAVEALVPEEGFQVERAFSRPGYSPGWSGLAFAMMLWCGGTEATPFLLLPPLLLAAALMLLLATAVSWFQGQDRIRCGTCISLWLALALCVPLGAYCGRFHSEPWLLLLLASAWALWLAGRQVRTGDARLPWPQVLLAGLLLGATCLVKREGLLWCALVVAALPCVPGIDWRRWLSTAGLVGGFAVVALLWRAAVGAGLEDFSLAAWTHWRELGQHELRFQRTWERVRDYLWAWPVARDVFAMLIPIGLSLWLLTLPLKVIAAGKGLRLALARHLIGQALPLAVVVVGGTAAIVAMFSFSTVVTLFYHLTAVSRLMLLPTAAAFLLAALALAPSRVPGNALPSTESPNHE